MDFRSNTLYIFSSGLKIEEELKSTLQNSQNNINIGYLVMTFSELIDRIYNNIRSKKKVISRIGQKYLLNEIVKELYLNKEESYFGPLINYKGFLDSLSEFIQSLKQSLITFERFEEITSKFDSKIPHKYKELIEIYKLYENALKNRNLLDENDKEILVMEHLEDFSYEIPFLEGINKLVVNGIYNFPSVQFAIVKSLSIRIGNAEISFPYDFDRPDLFEYVSKTVLKFEKLYDIDANIDLNFQEPKKENETLFKLLKSLFKDVSKESRVFTETNKVEPKDSIYIIETYDRLKEVEEIAKEVRRLLDLRISPKEIGVVFPNISSYIDLVEEVFRNYNIPFFSSYGILLNTIPVIKTIYSIFELIESNFEREKVLKFIKSNYVTFRLNFDNDESISLDELEKITLDASITDDKKNGWLGRLSFLISQKESYLKQLESINTSSLDIETLEYNEKEKIKINRYITICKIFANAIYNHFEMLKELKEKNTISGYIKILKRIINKLNIRKNLLNNNNFFILRRDSLAFYKFNLLLDNIENSVKELGYINNYITLGEFYKILYDTTNNEFIPFPKNEKDSVKVIDLLDSRGLTFEYVFLGGMVEGEFPKRKKEDPIFKDNERIEYNKIAGEKVFNILSDKKDEEALLFYFGISSVKKRLYITYLTPGSSKEESLRSYYVDELISCLDLSDKGISSITTTFLANNVIPPFNQIFSEEELLRRLIFNIWQRDEEDEGTTLTIYNQILKDKLLIKKLNKIWESSKIEKEREVFFQIEDITKRNCNVNIWTGKIENGNLIQILKKIYEVHNRNKWSSTRLEDYLRCPFHFFIKNILKIESWKLPELEIEKSYEGQIIHKILEVFLKWLKIAPDEKGKYEKIKLIANEIFNEKEKERYIGHQALWSIKKETILELLNNFVKAEEEYYKEGYLPAFFEVTFGEKGNNIENVSFIGFNGEKISLSGKIDRIDINENEGGFLVIDYKNSESKPFYKKILDNIGEENIQIPLYMIVAEYYLKNKGIMKKINRKKGTFYILKKGERLPPIEENDDNKNFFEIDKEKCDILKEKGEKNLLNIITQIVENARNGLYPITPQNCNFCDYPDICRYVNVDLKENDMT